MKSRILLAVLLAAGIVAAGGRAANASIILYTLDQNGEVQPLDEQSELAQAIQLSVEGDGGLFADLGSLDNASRLPVLKVLTFSSKAVEKSEAGLRTLEFDVRNMGRTAEFGCLVQSSLDGFGPGCPVMVAKAVTTDGSDKIRYLVELDERFQGHGDVDFRVYVYSEDLAFDGVRINGEVVVAPEPNSSLVWFFMFGVLILMATGAWASRRNREALSYAMAGGGQRPAMDREPWSDNTRQAILGIIDRGRNG